MACTWQTWCRLCAKKDAANDSHYKIYTDLDNNVSKDLAAALKNKKLDEVLEKFFSLKISRKDAKPKILCMECINHISNAIKFNECVLRIQNMYDFLVQGEYTLCSEERLNEIRLKFKISYISELQQREKQIVTQFIKQETDDSVEPECNKNGSVSDSIKEENYVVDGMERNGILLGLVDNTDETEDKTKPIHNYNNLENENLENTKQKRRKEEEEDYDHKEDNNYDEKPLDNNLKELKKSEESEQDHREKKKSPTKRKRKAVACSEPKQKKIKHYDIKNNPSFPLELTCKECNLEIKTYGNYKVHVKRNHQKRDAQNRFKCLQCGNTFKFYHGLEKHLIVHAPEELRTSHKCQECEECFATSKRLQYHFNTKHNDEKPYTCEECGYRVRTEANLIEHMLTHTDEKPFECEMCQNKFKNKARLKRHFVDKHTGIEHRCQICGLVLKSYVTLKRHSLVHTSEIPHKCDNCGRGFKRMKSLKQHLILHTGLEPYSCQFCPRTFANGSNCRKHMKNNHPEELKVLEASGNKPQTFIPRIETLKAVSKAVED